MKWKLLSVGLATVFTLVGCQGNDTNDDNQPNDNGDNNVENTRYNNTADNQDNGQTLRNAENADRDRGDMDRNRDNNRDNNNNRYEVADKAADKITDQIDVIDNAYVLTTDNNAYVAAGLDNNGDNDMNNRADNNGNDNGINQNGVNNNGNNDNGDELTDDVKRKITDIVKSVDGDIDNVYVSTNPDFLDLANNYADDADNGEPVEGFFDQIGNMIERVFPQDNK
ncbi:YhcN/YlaJ family sporulation lipoprotein [Lentibacillus sp. Marseille-P4043]|uniref:YhcN/YlaJ family sporulation lipoprotein n=1 Tax=Lentibacillus sp. Marseille-P4043 TaxID=2040293 RepID=UPI000D0BD255|nr:YhcN/YlaJ family sporulation lipoprotein [Lentibacillus sp. Marseille-P4043]